MKRITTLAVLALAACSSPDPSTPDGSNNGGSTNNGATIAPNNGGDDAGTADEDTGGGNDGEEMGTPPDPDLGFSDEIPDAIDSSGARFAGRLGAGEKISIDLTVFQSDRVTMWLRKAGGTTWDPSINVIRRDNGETLVWGNPPGDEDASIPFRQNELEAGYEFWFSGTYDLELENRGSADGEFEFTLECRGGPCAIDAGDADLDGTPDASDDCPYLPGDCDAAPSGSDDELESALRTEHAGHDTLNYTEARVHMFAWIDNVDGEVEGVYTGKKVATVEIPDASQLNTEHTWPQGRSGGDPATESDLHHIFPTDPDANQERASLNFGVVVNAEWEVGGSKRGRDAGGDTRFEPRDQHKGDAARAIFYYAVIYGQDVPAYEEEVLRQWHADDPPDDRERRRNQAIDNVQGSRNPFIDFPELVGRISDY